MKEHNEIDALFESAFDGLILTPDTFVKENIDHAIASKKKRRRFLFILFPVLFGTLCLAAGLYCCHFYTSSTRHTHSSQKQNEKRNILQSRVNRPGNAVQTTNEKQVKSNNQPAQSVLKVPYRQKNTVTIMRASKVDSFDPEIPSENGIESTNSGTDNSPEIGEITGTIQQDTLIVPETKPDSTIAINSIDSANTIVPETISSDLAVKPDARWSLAVLTYWEGEKKRTADLADEPFVNFKRETGVIHSSTFYGKIEFNYKFTQRWEALTGIGFRFSRIVQYGYVDSIQIPLEGLGSVVPITPQVPDTVRHREAQSFRVNSIVLPIGFGYSQQLGNKMRIRISAGAEFAYGQFARQNLNSTLSDPALRPFGCSIWARPELSYSFGTIELVGFGTFNQTLMQQLRWDFEPRRNPAFGGGIGLRFRLY